MPSSNFTVLIAALAACSSNAEGPQNDGPPPAAYALKTLANGYTVNIAVGSQPFDAILDTGSTTLAVAGSSCYSCTNVSPLYTPGSTAMDLGSATTSQYGIGDWMGEIYSDTVAVTNDTLAPFEMKLVDISSQMDFFPTEDAPQGIIGFGPAQLALPDTDAYVTDRIGTGDSGIFAVQMCDYNGTLWFGGADKTHEVSDEQYTALAAVSDDQPYYLVDVQSATIGSTSVGLSGAMVPDTGTSVLLFPTDAANAFAAAISANSGFTSTFIGQDFQLVTTASKCLTTPRTPSEIDAALPKIEITFADLDGKPFTVSLNPTSSYLQPVGGEYCIAIGAIDPSDGFGILGDAFLRSVIAVYDPVGSKIGFAPQQGCVNPDAAQQPRTTPWVPLVHGHPLQLQH
jgi:Eukaryotic aspartyl protease